jgi:hypothetical protein
VGWCDTAHQRGLGGSAHGPASRLWLEAYFWLEKRLEDGLAWSGSDLEKEGIGEHDLTPMAIRRAKKALGVVSRQRPGEAHAGWTWHLPPLPITNYPPLSTPLSPLSTDSYDLTDSSDTTDTPDYKTNTYEDNGQVVSDASGLSLGSDVSVEGVVTRGEDIPLDPLTPMPATDCSPPPCPHTETRVETMPDGYGLERCQGLGCRWSRIIPPKERKT